MRFSITLIALAAPLLVSAAPVKRIAAQDLSVLRKYILYNNIIGLVA